MFTFHLPLTFSLGPMYSQKKKHVNPSGRRNRFAILTVNDDDDEKNEERRSLHEAVHPTGTARKSTGRSTTSAGRSALGTTVSSGGKPSTSATA